VLLQETTVKLFPKFLAIFRETSKTVDKSASPFSFGGVPTVIKTISDLEILS